jgi:nicotinamide mononucleotide adenylyltransferase
MLTAALEASSWISPSAWEITQKTWSRTLFVLKAHQEAVNKSYATRSRKIPRVMLLAGADLVESFAQKGVWIPEQLQELLSDFGVVCIQREQGKPLHEVISSSQLLQNAANRIIVVQPGIRVVNNVSSSLVRELIGKGLSAKFIIPDSVLLYIEQNELYKCKKGTQNTILVSASKL